MDKTKPHDPFLKGGAQTENALLLFTPTHGALLGSAIRSFFQDNFFSKLSTIRQQSPPEFA
jgi:hypothetical protein